MSALRAKEDGMRTMNDPCRGNHDGDHDGADLLDGRCGCGHLLGMHEPNDHTGGACLEVDCDCDEYVMPTTADVVRAKVAAMSDDDVVRFWEKIKAL
jgi:hypothetical protein